MSKNLSLAWIIPFLGFVFGYLGTYFFVQQHSIITPNVIGKGIQESAEILSKHRLGVRFLKELEDSSLPEGVIMDQFPRGGDKIRPNQNIFITVSKKPRIFLTPDFLCLKQKDILAISAKNGIDVSIIPIFSQSSANTCIAQNPKPMVDMSRRRVVACISRGMFPLVIIPNLKGALVQDVKSLLRQYDVQFDVVGTSTSSDGCKIIEQSPVAGSIIAVDRPVQIQLQVE
ncbi:MAG: Protein kinase [candidate division TM6 bacterium GW2011_GWF2_37_49]|nr:MAG: Protein kinase [candidate division TM6 bacterium GW2011_GWF2_37_49]